MNTRIRLSQLNWVAAVLLALPSIASATILATSSFEDNTLGALSGQGGGSGWTGNWTAPGLATRADVVDTTSSPLVYAIPGGAVINGESKALEAQLLPGLTGNQLCGVRTLAAPISETFYVGYLVRYTGPEWAGGNNTFTLHLGINSSSTTTLNFGLRGGAPDEFVIRYATGTPVTGASTGGQLVNNTTYYLVARVNYSGGSFVSANMWLNPSQTDDVDTPSGDASLTLTPFANPITHIFFRQAALQADDIIQADELRIGTTWGDVVLVPEPGSVTLLSLGAAALLIFRRSHHRA